MELGSNNGTEFIQNDEIPDPLKKLARLILRGFYAFDHSLSKSNIIMFDKLLECYFSSRYFGAKSLH